MRLASLAAPLDRDAALAVANTRHGRDARRPVEASDVARIGGGFDRLRSGAETVRFLSALGVATPRAPLERQGLLRLKLVREAVRALAEGDGAGHERRMRRVLAGATYRIDDGVLRPQREGWDGFVDALAPALNELAAAARRLKVCHNSACGWVFVDETLNGGQVWCTAQGCGPRMRVRRYRRRNARSAIRS